MTDDLYYEENHFWVREEGDLLVMGLDDLIHGKEAIEKWVLADIEKYKEEARQ